MKTLYRLLELENEKLRKQNEQLVEFVKTTQIVASHLIQDEDVIGYGRQATQDVLDIANQLCNTYKISFTGNGEAK
jgi:hypothetical protein